MGFRFESFEGTDRTFAMRGDEPPIVLEEDGVRHPRSARRPTPVLTRYEDLTHVAASARVMWIGARSSVYVIPRASFARYDAPERLIAALLERVAARPGGAAQLARMEAVERIGRESGPPVATWTLMAICMVVYLAQIALGYEVSLVGEYKQIFVADGDVWRLITANLLHAQPPLGVLHFGLNLIALLALGMLVERPLGAARTACVMGVSGVAAMLASGWFGSAPVVGVSGVVFGLAGGVLWLDYRRAEELPAWWRFPRRSFLGLLALNGALGVIVPFIALAAHAGGFVAGTAATALVAGRVGAPPPVWIRGAAAGVIALTTLAVGTAGMEIAAGDDLGARYAARTARLPGTPPEALNDLAWLIAISDEPSQAELKAALMLAERAVAETERSEATILDTLAEVQFALGATDAAITTIDEAIARAPEDPYFREQRRRFTGERAADDRPNYVPPWIQVPERRPPEPPAKSEPELTV